VGAGHDGGDGIEFEQHGTGSPDISRRQLFQMHFHEATLVGYIEFDMTSEQLTVYS